MFFRFCVPICLFLTSFLHGYYIGNPADPNIIRKGFFTGPKSIISFKAALIDDWTHDRTMKRKGGRDFKDFEANANGIEGTLCFMHRLNVCGYFGTDSMKGTFYGLSNEELYFKTKNSYATYYGGKLILYEKKNLTFGLSGKYQHAKAKLGRLRNNGTEINVQSNTRLHYDEYQFAFMGAYTLNFLIPYVGLFYYYVDAEFMNLPSGYSSVSRIDITNKYQLGVVAGLTVSSHDLFALSAEVRLLSEMATGIEVAIKF